MKNIKIDLKIISIIIGTLIGAGFATGKEINIFFVNYGIYGLFGLFLSCIFLSFIIYKTFIIIDFYKINNYSDFLNILLGNNLFKKIFIFLINSFLYLSYFIMISGFCSYFYQEFNFPHFFSCLFICFFCFNIFKKNIEKILNINFILIPFLIFFIILFGFLDFSKINIYYYLINLEKNNFLLCFLKSILYLSYNCLILIPILISLKKYLKNKRQFISLGIFSGLFILVLSLIIFIFIILIDNPNLIEIPIIKSISNFSYIQKNIYGLIIAIAIFTSAISSGFGFKNNINYRISNLYLFIFCFLPILFLKIKFSFLVNLIFNIFGYIGLLQIIFILLKKNNKTDINIK